jgi:hypothetical protein
VLGSQPLLRGDHQAAGGGRELAQRGFVALASYHEATAVEVEERLELAGEGAVYAHRQRARRARELEVLDGVEARRPSLELEHMQVVCAHACRSELFGGERRKGGPAVQQKADVWVECGWRGGLAHVPDGRETAPPWHRRDRRYRRADGPALAAATNRRTAE